MNKKLLLCCAAGLVLLLAGCSHTYVLPIRHADNISAAKLAGRNVVLSLNKNKVAESYSGKAGGHNFTVVNVHGFVANLFTSLLSASSATFHTVRDGQQLPPADLVLLPSLKVTYQSGLASQSCLAECTLEAVDRKGVTLASATKQGEYRFTVMKNGGRACEIAMYNAIGPAIDAVLAGL